jgi:hypothetical protein
MRWWIKPEISFVEMKSPNASIYDLESLEYFIYLYALSIDGTDAVIFLDWSQYGAPGWTEACPGVDLRLWSSWSSKPYA